MSAKWTVRKRTWPNGRPYFVIMRGRSEVIVGAGGGESKYQDRSIAEAVAREMNRPPEHSSAPPSQKPRGDFDIIDEGDRF